MELARWTPRRNAWGLQNRMNRLFDDFFCTHDRYGGNIVPPELESVRGYL